MSIANGPKIAVMVSAANGDTYGDAARQQFRMFQTLIQGNVKSMSLNTPPGSPVNGDTYVVASGGTGAWLGQDNNVAYWTTDDPNVPAGKWEFYVPLQGWYVFNQASGNQFVYRYNGTIWVLSSIAGRKIINTAVSGPTLTIDASQGNSFAFTLTGSVTSSSIINPTDGQEITIKWLQDGVGSHTVTPPTNVKGFTAPSAGASTNSVQRFTYDLASGNWYAVGAGTTGL